MASAMVMTSSHPRSISQSRIQPQPTSPPTPSQSRLNPSAGTACPSCGQSFTATTRTAEDANRRIADLEAQVKLLNSKAATAVDKLADYEDEVRHLRSLCAQQDSGKRSSGGAQDAGRDADPPNVPLLPSQQQQQPPPQPPQQTRFGTLRALLSGPKRDVNSDSYTNPAAPAARPTTSHGRSTSNWTLNFGSANASTPNLHQPALPAPPQLPEPTLHSLQSSLQSERQLRIQAESNLTQTQHELEELTAQLFGQANEMVAQERRERAKLEERVKVLERREREKGERVRRLEERVGRVERVRGLVG